jgi:acetolactate synthase I/II/III large subunit
LNRVYRADLAICANIGEFAECAALWDESEVIPFDAGANAHANGSNSRRRGAHGTKLDLARCVAAAREVLPADSVICNGAGNFSGWWHRYWPTPAGPLSSRRPAGRWATECPQRSPQRCACRDAAWSQWRATATS